jgi:predicted metal-dependent hydrolase
LSSSPSNREQSSGDSLTIQSDPRFCEGIALFNSKEWYAAHDVLEELWHETSGPERRVLQGLIQVAVAHVHLQNGNQRGATILLGEGLGRFASPSAPDLGLDLLTLQHQVTARLKALQHGEDADVLEAPTLHPR